MRRCHSNLENKASRPAFFDRNRIASGLERDSERAEAFGAVERRHLGGWGGGGDIH